MKKLLLITVFLSPFLISQEFDKKFLETLPDDVRNSVEQKVTAQADAEKPVYRRASSMLDKPINKSNVFGSNFFDTMQSSFMPTNEPNFDSSYVLDFGDILEIQLIGQRELKEEFSIKRDGSINVANIGSISLSGLSMDQASSLIKSKVESIYIGTDAYISLVNVRDIQVLITGNAYNPGIYTLNGNSNVLHALSMAGGIDELGSFREIKLIRNNKHIETIDLYNTFVYGKSNHRFRLRSGDSIVVSPSINIINVLSGVNRIGSYELKQNETLYDLVNYANGLNSSADINFIQLQSLNKDSVITTKLSVEDFPNVIAEDNDTLIIREYVYYNISISGAITSPGDYKIRRGDTLSTVIKRAGGYLQSSYPFGGYLDNIKSKELNLMASKSLEKSFLLSMLTNGSSNGKQEGGEVSSLMSIFSNDSDYVVPGRKIVEFDLDVIKAYPELDTVLEDGDALTIPTNTNQVYLFGEVSNEGGVRYSPNKSIEYYINLSGGILDSADISSAYILSPNGETINYITKNGRLSFLRSKQDILIYPGSIVFIPREGQIQNKTLIASIWAPIISSFALSIASISALNN